MQQGLLEQSHLGDDAHDLRLQVGQTRLPVQASVLRHHDGNGTDTPVLTLVVDDGRGQIPHLLVREGERGAEQEPLDV